MMKQMMLPIINDSILKIYIKKPFFLNMNSFTKQIDFKIKSQFSCLKDMNEKYLGYYLDANCKGIWLCFILRDFKRDTKPYLK